MESEPRRPDDIALVLEYARATYRAQTELRRRLAAVMAVLAVLLALFSIWATVQWADTRAEVAAVDDEALVEALGVRIPDPRPAIERGHLRVQAFLWGSVAVIGALWTVATVGLWLLIRPRPAPPEVQAHLRSPRDQRALPPAQPPM